MRLIKLYIDNFKGVKNPTIIEFDKPVNILEGPNGFGKTTIFDALEVCLTGKIYRTSIFEQVTNDTRDYIDAFYRNTAYKDVILHLLLENQDGGKVTIVKRLPADSTGRVDGSTRTRKYKVSAWDLLKTYILPEDHFAKPDISYGISDEKDQQDIDGLILGADGEGLSDLYKLFAYLQQSENTFYLKKTEGDRRKQLDHLFRTDDEAEVSRKLDECQKSLKSLLVALKQKVESLGKIDDQTKEVEYTQLLLESDSSLDALHPFSGIDLTQVDQKYSEMRKSLSNIKDFIGSFDPDVYAINKAKQEIFSLAKNDQFLNYAIFRDLLGADSFRTVSQLSNLKHTAKNEAFLQFFILQNYLKDSYLEDLRARTEFYDVYNTYFEDINKPSTIEEKITHLEGWDSGLSEVESLKVSQYSKRLTELIKNLEGTQLAVESALEIRDNLQQGLSNMPDTHTEDGVCECPFCGFNWENITKLNENIQAKTDKLVKYLDGATKQLSKLKEDIEKEFLGDFEKKIREYIDQHKSRKNFLSILERLKRQAERYKYASSGEFVIAAVNESKRFIWSEVQSAGKLSEDVSALSQLIDTRINLDTRVFDRLSALRGISFDEGMKFLGNRKIDLPPAWKIDGIGNLGELDSAIDQLRELLMSKAYEIEIDSSKLGGEFGYMYKELFLEKRENLHYASLQLDKKIAYVDSEYHTSRRRIYRVLQTRVTKLSALFELTKTLRKNYDTVLTDYKKEMVDKIRLPFYVFSAKILQNYQQGMGVFITSSSGGNDAVRFLTESRSDHDVVHHLSSGQLAVVSIAFTLAINRVYANNSLKLLAIDDPVYELDNLNVHAFVELLRHDFVDDFQIILSTHDQESATYMKYKIEKLQPQTVNLISVQDIFYKATE